MKLYPILLAAIILILSSCRHRDIDYDVPSPPEPTRVECDLELQYLDKEMPLHTVVNLNETRSDAEAIPVSRHIIKVYDTDRREVASVVLTDDADNATETRRHTFSLFPGKYTAVGWTDYADGNDSDWHYDTSAFPDVELQCTADDDGLLVHQGNTLWRDAYCGSRAFSLGDDGSVAFDDGSEGGIVLIEMRRPMARFLFEATDFQEFADAHSSDVIPADASAGQLAGYSVSFRYHEYMPSLFNAQSDAPVDSRVGAAFPGEPRSAESGSGAIEIGSDFVFVHPLETSVKVAVEIHSASTGKVVARAGPVTVPLLRNRLTIVRGRFLTSQSEPGIVIDTGFDGNYNIEIK